MTIVTIVMILAIMVGAALAMAAVAHTRRWLEKNRPIQPGVGKRLNS
jgi:hypothetical protein